MTDSSSYIGCFQLDSSFFATVEDTPGVISAAVCSRTCYGEAQGVFGLGPLGCACGGLLPDSSARVADSSCNSNCRDFDTDPCGSIDGIWSVFYSNYTGPGPTSSVPSTKSVNKMSKSLVAAVILPIAIVVLTIVGVWWYWRKREKRRGHLGKADSVPGIRFEDTEKGWDNRKSESKPFMSDSGSPQPERLSASSRRDRSSHETAYSQPFSFITTASGSKERKRSNSSPIPPASHLPLAPSIERSSSSSRHIKDLSKQLSRRLSQSTKELEDSPKVGRKKTRRVKKQYGIGDEDNNSGEEWMSENEVDNLRNTSKAHRFSDHGHPYMMTGRPSSMSYRQMSLNPDYFSLHPHLNESLVLSQHEFLNQSFSSQLLPIRRENPPPSSYFNSGNSSGLRRNNSWGHYLDTSSNPSTPLHGYLSTHPSQKDLFLASPFNSPVPSGFTTPLDTSSPMLVTRSASSQSQFVEPFKGSSMTMKEKLASVDLLKRSSTLDNVKMTMQKADDDFVLVSKHAKTASNSSSKKEGILKGGKLSSRPDTSDSNTSGVSSGSGVNENVGEGSKEHLLTSEPPSPTRIQFAEEPFKVRRPTHPSKYNRQSFPLQPQPQSIDRSHSIPPDYIPHFGSFSLPPLIPHLDVPTSIPSTNPNNKRPRRTTRSTSESFVGQLSPFVMPFHTGKVVNSLGSLVSDIEREQVPHVAVLGLQPLSLTNPDPPSTPKSTQFSDLKSSLNSGTE